MTADSLRPLVEGAQDALRSFFGTLLGAGARLDAGTPARAEAPPSLAGAALLLGQPAGAPPFAVVLDNGWVDALAHAMLGGPVPRTAAGDLLGEAAGQAFGALRTHLAAGGLAMPDVAFRLADAQALAHIPPPVWRFPFSLAHAGGALQGAVFLSEAALPAAAPAAAPAPAASAPAASAPTAAPSVASVEVAPVTFSDLGGEHIVGGDGASGFPDLTLLSDVELEVTVELGRRRLPLADVLRLTTGSVIELDKLVGQPLEVYANGRLIAEGEAVVIDEQFGVRVTSLSTQPKPRSTMA